MSDYAEQDQSEEGGEQGESSGFDGVKTGAQVYATTKDVLETVEAIHKGTGVAEAAAEGFKGGPGIGTVLGAVDVVEGLHKVGD